FSWPWHDLAVAIAWNRPNVYIDINAIRLKYLPSHIFQYMKTVLRDKILFAHDYPMFDTRKMIREFEELPLSPEVKKRIREDNPRRFLGIG
ncbi:MAG: amidohydrolase family protein, partial [Thermodesulfobacteriota bacterium]|nr:amidohydrolase family protein [Thermodesulfobacteriota bacterium]